MSLRRAPNSPLARRRTSAWPWARLADFAQDLRRPSITHAAGSPMFSLATAVAVRAAEQERDRECRSMGTWLADFLICTRIRMQKAKALSAYRTPPGGTVRARTVGLVAKERSCVGAGQLNRCGAAAMAETAPGLIRLAAQCMPRKPAGSVAPLPSKDFGTMTVNAWGQACRARACATSCGPMAGRQHPASGVAQTRTAHLDGAGWTATWRC